MKGKALNSQNELSKVRAQKVYMTDLIKHDNTIGTVRTE